jgi:hypothetical protein
MIEGVSFFDSLSSNPLSDYKKLFRIDNTLALKGESGLILYFCIDHNSSFRALQFRRGRKLRGTSPSTIVRLVARRQRLR